MSTARTKRKLENTGRKKREKMLMAIGWRLTQLERMTHEEKAVLFFNSFHECEVCHELLSFTDYPYCPHGNSFGRYAQRFAPIVVFRKSDGTYSVPGQSSTRTPRGCERVELRSFSEIRQVTEEMNAVTRAEYEQRAQSRDAFMSAARAQSRGELREAMKRMSPFGRRLAELAIAKTDARKKSTEMPTAFFPIMEYDSHSLEPHNDLNTGWKDRRA